MVLCHPTSKEEEPRFSLVGEMIDTRDDPNGEVSGSLRVNQEYLLMVKVPINMKQLSMSQPDGDEICNRVRLCKTIKKWRTVVHS